MRGRVLWWVVASSNVFKVALDLASTFAQRRVLARALRVRVGSAQKGLGHDEPLAVSVAERPRPTPANLWRSPGAH